MNTAPLAGALDTLGLAEVLQLLEVGRNSGVLAVDGAGGVRGMLRLTDGRLTAARVRRADGAAVDDVVDAVAALLDVRAGRFSFSGAQAGAGDGTERAADDAAASWRIEAVLMETARRADERARDAAPAAGVHPRHAHVPALTPGYPGRPTILTLAAAEWALLAAVDGRRDVRAVAEAVGRPVESVATSLDELAGRSVVRWTPAPPGVTAVTSPDARSSTG